MEADVVKETFFELEHVYSGRRQAIVHLLLNLVPGSRND